jgi:hypothetical protein
MTFKSGANGIAKKGKTKGKNFGDSGPSVGIQNMIKGKGGKTNENMKSMGRNMAKIAAQRGK